VVAAGYETMDVAREHRKDSMAERKYLRDNTNEVIFEREFSLWSI
jgi:hypothetical protein